ncbi:helix-turn-helix transcriptional regulator [Roseobacter weihaiensis]|uniref:helix-turn-helix transcriptional regulator n=1 Tax=Roseobacter weihaiensis TaxID=2763262 RepID=UPI001D0A43B2|nr:AraC family transcriptional regulator [Roseobacter sp. H9]
MSEPQHAAPGQRFDSYAEFYQKSTYADFPQEHRSNGSFGLTMVEVQQEAFDFIDPPLPEIVFVHVPKLRGRAFTDFGDGVKAVENPQPNMLQVTPPWTESHCGVDQPHQIMAAALPLATVDHLLGGYGLGENVFSKFYAPGTSAAHATALVGAMWRYSTIPGGAANLYLDGLTMQFLALTADSAGISPIGPGRPEDVRITRVIDYIEAHYGEPLAVAELAAVAAMSPSHFSKCFKATTGEPVWVYVQRRRCERARDKLATTHEAIAQIAYACGFANQGHLTSVFKKTFGVTPGQVRRV